MQVEIIILSEFTKRKTIPYHITYIRNLKYGTNEPIYKTETDSQAERSDFWLPRLGGGRVRMMYWELGVGRCKLLHLKWINKILLFSRKNYIQSPDTNYNGKEHFESMYMDSLVVQW